MNNIYDFPPQTVLKVLSRLKYPVPPHKARSGFSILAKECLTFQTVSPTDQCYMIYRIRKTDT